MGKKGGAAAAAVAATAAAAAAAPAPAPAPVPAAAAAKREGVVSAAEVLAAAAEAAAAKAVTYKTDDLTYDLGLLAAFDSHPLDPAALVGDGRDAALIASARDNAQLLVRHIFELPVESTAVGPVAMLPAATTRLPRAKPVPKPRPLTRWEKFAKSKGIEKKKRGRMVWDEATGEWAPRHGYKRVGDESRNWAMEVKAGAPDDEDPFERAALEKKQRIVKNELAHVQNLQRATKAGDAATGPFFTPDGGAAGGRGGGAAKGIPGAGKRGAGGGGGGAGGAPGGGGGGRGGAGGRGGGGPGRAPRTGRRGGRQRGRTRQAAAR